MAVLPGADAEATVQYRKEVLVVVIAVLLLPVLVLLMLPGAIFGCTDTAQHGGQ